MPNPWDVPPGRDHGDNSENALFSAIGMALTEWEQVEASCAELFAVLVSVSRKTTYHAPAIRAYGTVVSYAGRCEMLRAAADAYFLRRKKQRAEFEGKLNSLINECLQFAARRNEIAHGRVSLVYYGRGNQPMRNIGYYLFPSLYNPRKYKLESQVTYKYTSHEVLHFKQEFTKLHLRIEGLRTSLTG